MKTKYDINGNRLLVVKSNIGGFSIQTDGNIDYRMNDDLNNQETIQRIFNSLNRFIKEHGTERQKNIMRAMELETTDLYRINRPTTEIEKVNLIDLLTWKCRSAAYIRICSIINYEQPKNYGLQNWQLERLNVNVYTGRVSYCAGQDYPAEISQIKNQLKK